MKTKLLFLLPLFLILFGCSSDNNTGTPEPEKVIIIPEKEILKSITYEVLVFEYTADTGNKTSRLQYKIKYTNPNNVAIKGYSSITMDYNGLILTPIKRLPQDSYIEIGANSSYTEVYNVESPHETTLLSPEQIQSFYVKFVSTTFTIVE